MAKSDKRTIIDKIGNLFTVQGTTGRGSVVN